MNSLARKGAQRSLPDLCATIERTEEQNGRQPSVTERFSRSENAGSGTTSRLRKLWKTVAEGEMRRTSQAKRAEGTAVPPAKIELADESRHFDSRKLCKSRLPGFLCCGTVAVFFRFATFQVVAGRQGIELRLRKRPFRIFPRFSMNFRF